MGRENRTGPDWTRRAATALLVLSCGIAWGRPSFDESSLRRLLAAHGFAPAETRAVIATLERAEQQALAKYGLNYVTDTYMPEKLVEIGLLKK